MTQIQLTVSGKCGLRGQAAVMTAVLPMVRGSKSEQGQAKPIHQPMAGLLATQMMTVTLNLA